MFIINFLLFLYSITKVITTREISFRIEDIIKNAKEEILLITPYLKIDTTLYEWLKIADSHGVLITLIYGKDKLLRKQEQQLKKLNNCKVLFSKNLHAKVYLNENEGVIASMNLYEYSEVNNLEIGVHFSKVGYEDNTYQQTRKEIAPILNYARLEWDSLESKEKEYERISIDKILKSDDKNVSIKGFPIEGISLGCSYGFATYTIKLKNVDLKKLCKKHLPTFENELGKNYRMYWKYPYTRIFLYDSESKEFSDDVHKKNYRAKGIRLSNSLIKNCFYF